MDTVQYLDGDWNNRNKIKTPNNEFMLSVPVNKKETQGKNLNEIKIFKNLTNPKEFWQRKHWESIKINYKKAFYFDDYADDFEKMYSSQEWDNLSDICWYQFNYFIKCLDLNDVEIIRMSQTKFEGQKDNLILNHCKKLNASAVVFGSQGRNYVDIDKFNKEKKYVYFQDYKHPIYKQRFSGFLSNLSVIDLLFNCGPNSREILLSNNISKKDLKSSNFWHNKF